MKTVLKNGLRALLCLLLLAATAAASAEDAREPLVLTRLHPQILRVEGYDRMVNDASAFSVRWIRDKVEAFNAAIDPLGSDRPPIYLYLAETSRSHQIARDFSEDSPDYLYLREHLHADAFDHLKYSTFEQYCDYFYTTDHHWNYKGSYQAYVDIVRLLLGDDEPVLVPAETVVTRRIFNGSYARNTKEPISKEYFALYRFDPMPAYKAYQDGRRKNYDRMAKYLAGNISTDKLDNHYALCYGGDVGVLEMYADQHKDRTLLMIGNSLSNAVKPLLTAHYGTIICVDLRHYKASTGKDLSLSKAIRQYQPDQILLLGDVCLFIEGRDPVP